MPFLAHRHSLRRLWLLVALLSFAFVNLRLLSLPRPGLAARARIRALTFLLALAGAGPLLAPVAAAGPITVISSTRELHVNVRTLNGPPIFVGVPPDVVSASDTRAAVDLEPFDETLTLTVTLNINGSSGATGTALQTSQVGSESLIASGRAIGEGYGFESFGPAHADGFARAESIYEIVFTVSTEVEFTLAGVIATQVNASAASGTNTGESRVSLKDMNGLSLFEVDVVADACVGGTCAVERTDFFEAGVITPGGYTLRAESLADAGAARFGRRSTDSSFSLVADFVAVPEGDTLTLVLIGLVSLSLFRTRRLRRGADR